ncbi:MAG TPA: sigma-70 factor domain-containing protein, partial [Solirubrobacteraceae bacterium]
MAHSPADTTITLDPAAVQHDGETEADAVVGGAVAAAPEQLDNPIERIDVGTPDTFIPEAVDQLLAHSRRYPLLTPEQEIDLAKKI